MSQYTFVAEDGGPIYGAFAILCRSEDKEYKINVCTLPPQCTCRGYGHLVKKTGGRQMCKHIKLLFNLYKDWEMEERGDKYKSSLLEVTYLGKKGIREWK